MTCKQCLNARHIRCGRNGCECTVCYGSSGAAVPRVVAVYDDDSDQVIQKVLLKKAPKKSSSIVSPPTFCSPVARKPRLTNSTSLNRGADFKGDPRLFDANNMPELVLEVLQCIYDEITVQDEDPVAV